MSIKSLFVASSLKVIITLMSLLFIPNQSLDSELPFQVIIWNVGQGLWITAVHGPQCLHFDMGGEAPHFKTIRQKLNPLCSKKLNILALSHWDWDHISFVRQFSNLNFPTCLWKGPRGLVHSKKKKKLIDFLTQCSMTPQSVEELNFSYNPQISNQASRVFILEKKFLFPGDSPQKNERQWALAIDSPISTLVLGHHGSFTSTGNFLLKHLQELKLAISSANPRRYGHPHPLIRQRLKKNGISLLQTNFWGNIHLIYYPRKGRYSISKSRATGS